MSVSCYDFDSRGSFHHLGPKTLFNLLLISYRLTGIVMNDLHGQMHTKQSPAVTNEGLQNYTLCIHGNIYIVESIKLL